MTRALAHCFLREILRWRVKGGWVVRSIFGRFWQGNPRARGAVLWGLGSAMVSQGTRDYQDSRITWRPSSELQPTEIVGCQGICAPDRTAGYLDGWVGQGVSGLA